MCSLDVFDEVLIWFKVEVRVSGVSSAIEVFGFVLEALDDLVDAPLLLVAPHRFISAVEGVIY